MKLRNGFVSNSSSTSFLIKVNCEHISNFNELLEQLEQHYDDVSVRNAELSDIEDRLKHRFKDINVNDYSSIKKDYKKKLRKFSYFIFESDSFSTNYFLNCLLKITDKKIIKLIDQIRL